MFIVYPSPVFLGILSNLTRPAASPDLKPGSLGAPSNFHSANPSPQTSQTPRTSNSKSWFLPPAHAAPQAAPGTAKNSEINLQRKEGV
jgi:hypothetical protein